MKEEKIIQDFAKKILGEKNSILEMLNLVPSMLLHKKGKLINILIYWEIFKMLLPLIILILFFLLSSIFGSLLWIDPPASSKIIIKPWMTAVDKYTNGHYMHIFPLLWLAFCYYGGKKLFRIIFF